MKSSRDSATPEILLRTFARAIKDINEYIPGPDMGTDERCMAWLKSEIGRAVALPQEIGGIPLDEIGAAGFGLNVCTEVASNYCNVNLEGARIVIQGFSSVGQQAARFLAAKGTVLIAAADSQGTIFNPKGINIEQLSRLKSVGKTVIDYADGQKLNKDAVIGITCDILIPAARPDVIDSDNIDQLQTKLVLQGANIPFTEKAERICDQRNILVVPDFIANGGGVICGAVKKMLVAVKKMPFKRSKRKFATIAP